MNQPIDPTNRSILDYLRAGTRYDHSQARPAEGVRLRPVVPSVRIPEAAVVVFQRHIREAFPKLSPKIVTAHAQAWADLLLDRAEAMQWMAALGVAGAPKARECRSRNLQVGVMRVRLNGRSVSSRIRSGETVDSVIALAASLGVGL